MGSPAEEQVGLSCRECGTPLSRGSIDGFCPACTLEGALNAPSSPTQAGPDSATSPEPAQPGKAFGEYELIEEIARGGMGVVYRARQRSLNRIVALKMILTGQLASKEEILRFRAEAEMAARLHHSNIVTVHETGEHQGQHYFSMDFVQGRSLAEVVRDSGPLPGKRAAGYVRTIAQAIAYAHAQGVLHRDLKPSNVLIDADDQPRITDFGLAKHMRDEFGLTVTGQLLGSPNFMPPEQASGYTGELPTAPSGPSDSHGPTAVIPRKSGLEPASSVLPAPRSQLHPGRGRPGPATDVYGIGSILYYLLTGRPPFQAATIPEVLVQLRESDPIPPRRLNPSVPRDLETICLKCLEKEPTRRYATAREIADELGRFLSDEPIWARPVTRLESAWRWCRRRPALATLSALVAALVLVVVTGAPVALVRINAARLEAERALYASDMQLASLAVSDGNFTNAQVLLEKPRRGADDHRGLEWRYLRQAVRRNEPFHSFPGLPAPGGWRTTYLFRAGRFLLNRSANELKAWDMETWEPVPIVRPTHSREIEWKWYPSCALACAVEPAEQTLTIYRLPGFERVASRRAPGPISVMSLSYDGQALAAGYHDGHLYRILIWDLVREIQSEPAGTFEGAISSLAFSRDRTRLAAGALNGVVGIWDLATLRPLPAPPGDVRHLSHLEFTPDNRRLLFGPDPSLTVWDIDDRHAHTFELAGKGALEWFGLSPDARYYIAGRNKSQLHLFDSTNLTLKATLFGHRGLIGKIAFSPDGTLMASASVDQTARLWDLSTGTAVGLIGGFGQIVSNVEFSHDGKNVVLIGQFGQLRVHRLTDVLERGIFAYSPLQNPISRISLSTNSPLLASLTVEGTLTLWHRESRRRLRNVSYPRYSRLRGQESIPNLAFSPDGQRVAWVSGDALRIMSVESGTVATNEIDGNLSINSINFAPDGRELVFGCGNQLMLYDVGSGAFQSFVETDGEVFAVEYSPDGRLVAFGGLDGQVSVYDRTTRQRKAQHVAHPPNAFDVEMSPDGRLLATCGADSTIKLWNVQPDGSLLLPPRTLRGHVGYVCSLAFSPDGTRLVSACGDKTLKIWDPNSGAELGTLYGHLDYAVSVEIPADGRGIYSGGFDGEIRFWETPPLSALWPGTRSAPHRN